MGHVWYTLVGRKPVPCSNFPTVRESDRRVGRDEIGGAEVSTVFIYLDHRFGEGPPLVFETMIFGGEHDQYQERYSTWEEAEAGHARAVAMVQGDT